jgi:hypothetical protein
MSVAPLHSEEGRARKQRADWVFENALQSIDGARGTWSWMLEEGNHGYGLVPMIADIDYWDQTTQTWLLTKNQPCIYPAFIYWEATTGDDYDHCEEDVPVLSVVGGKWLGDDSDYHSMAVHTFLLDEECYFNSRGQVSPFFVPVWSVTPVDEETWLRWSDQFSKRHSHVEGWVIDSVLADGSDWHGEYDEPNTEKQIQCDGYHPDIESGLSCPCGLELAQRSIANDIYSGALWPTDLDDEFKDVWRWTVSRWLNGWNNINILGKDSRCQYSLASSHSPYSHTLDSDDLAHENERLCLIPSTNSALSPEYSTEPSPQLTLFDT